MAHHSRVPPDSTLFVTGTFQDQFTGDPINDATVTLTALYRKGSTEDVGGVTLPLTMPYVAASDGVYRAKIAASVDLDPRTWYRGKVRVVAGNGDERVFVEPIYVDAGGE